MVPVRVAVDFSSPNIAKEMHVVSDPVCVAARVKRKSGPSALLHHRRFALSNAGILWCIGQVSARGGADRRSRAMPVGA
jgi:hypothetical protein